ncbi:hypothetical protein [Qipengyuania sp. NPDC077563]|uniref:hypothetical protein n=1 Tax=Qipengyuania sp. NPDC077563 TaxID=3364497 RepID=UPI003850BA1E
MSRSPRFSCFASLVFLSIAACNGVSDGGGDPAAVAPSDVDQPVTSLRDVKGFWLILRFEEFEPSWENETPWRSAYVQIEGDRLTYNVGCNQSGNPATLGRDGVLRDTSDGLRMQTLQGCGQAREARDRRFFAFFGSSPQVRRMTEDRILLKSGERELVLIRPDRWREINKPDFAEIEGRWVPQMSTAYDGWGSAGFGIGGNPGVLTIERRRIVWSQCPNVPIQIRWTADARLTATDGVDIAKCAAVAHSSDNGPRAIMTILNANPAVIRTGQDYISLVDGTGEKGRRIDFRSEESVLNPPPPPPTPQELTLPPPPAPPRNLSADQ